MLVRVSKSKDVVAGKMRVFDVAGTKVNVANAGGNLHAFDDTCTHTGCSLAMGKLDGTTVTCPCHGSQFSIEDGSNVAGPSGSEAGSVGPLPEVGLAVDGDAISLA